MGEVEDISHVNHLVLVFSFALVVVEEHIQCYGNLVLSLIAAYKN